MKYDVVILGGGVSGLMMMNRLRHYHPTMSAIIIDKSTEISDHVFHLHRPIPEIPELCDKEYMKEYKFQSGVWSINGLVNSASIKDINDYSYKCFGKLHVSNAGNSAGFTIIPATFTSYSFTNYWL